MKWQTVEAQEDLYADGINDSVYTGYMRDEVYPFGIRFLTSEGYRTSVFPLIGRPCTDEEWENISQSNNKDVLSIFLGRFFRIFLFIFSALLGSLVSGKISSHFPNASNMSILFSFIYVSIKGY